MLPGLPFLRQPAMIRPLILLHTLSTLVHCGISFTSRPEARVVMQKRKSTFSHPSSAEQAPPKVPLYIDEGLFAVHKPLNWTSNDVVSRIRNMLEKDARQRGAQVERNRRRNNKNKFRVGHGGTLDPLATGVLVVGVGSGTKMLQGYLTGSKEYRARGELGYETTTLDMEGNVTKRADVDHVTPEALEQCLDEFRGPIEQIPPIFSAIRVDGKRLYQRAREGETTEDVKIESRSIHIYDLQLVESEEVNLPRFEILTECGGGTYIRSLVRDIGYAVDSVATTTLLERTKQGQFRLKDCLSMDDLTPENVYAAIRKQTERLASLQE